MEEAAQRHRGTAPKFRYFIVFYKIQDGGDRHIPATPKGHAETERNN